MFSDVRDTRILPENNSSVHFAVNLDQLSQIRMNVSFELMRFNFAQMFSEVSEGNQIFMRRQNFSSQSQSFPKQ